MNEKIVMKKIISLTLAFSFLVMSITGIMLYIVPKGKVAYWANWEMFNSAFLLFITNLVGIVLAALLTFLMLGFSPLAMAKKGIFYAMTLVVIVSVPLYISFSKMKHAHEIEQALRSFHATIGSKEIHLKNIKVQGKEVRCVVVTSTSLTKEEMQNLNILISNKVEEEVKILVSFVYQLSNQDL